ncbi:MAG: PAS domain S-box protein [Bacteroidota bacterium]
MSDDNSTITQLDSDLKKIKVLLSMPFTSLNNDSFQALFNYASIGILITNSRGEILMANKYIDHQFGYSENEIIGHEIETLIPPRYKDRHVQHREKYTNDPHSRPMGLGMELSALRKDGSEFPVEVSLGYYSVGGEKYALAFITDITQRKETEQAIIQLNAHLEQKVKEDTQSLALTVEQLSNQIKETERKDIELQRVNNFLNNIWNHAGAIIFVCDKNGVVQFFNPAAEKALGYLSSEIVNKHTLDIFHTPDELESRAAELSEELGKTIKPNFEVFVAINQLGKGTDQEWHYLRKNGSNFFVSLDVTPLKDARNNITSYLGIAIDISEKKKAEGELRAALQKEMELNELKSRFVSMASHEFRTPLSAIASSAFLLSKYSKTEEQTQREKHIHRITSSVTSLTEILNDFLSVGKIEEGNIHPHYSEFNVKVIMGNMIQEVNHLLKSGQNISYEHIGNECNVFLDPSMLKHIVINLLSNAIKFSPENSTIHFRTEKNSNKFMLSVKDQGIGIPEEEQQELFKRFFRSSNVTNIQGTGLGLHIVKKYVELMNGTISCKSKLGKGTEFILEF